MLHKLSSNSFRMEIGMAGMWARTPASRLKGARDGMCVCVSLSVVLSPAIIVNHLEMFWLLTSPIENHLVLATSTKLAGRALVVAVAWRLRWLDENRMAFNFAEMPFDVARHGLRGSAAYTLTHTHTQRDQHYAPSRTPRAHTNPMKFN